MPFSKLFLIRYPNNFKGLKVFGNFHLPYKSIDDIFRNNPFPFIISINVNRIRCLQINYLDPSMIVFDDI